MKPQVSYRKLDSRYRGNNGSVNYTLPLNLSQPHKAKSSSPYFVFLGVYFASLLFGVIFYRMYHEWSWATSIYYAAQVLIGCNYGIPEEVDGISKSFTLAYFIWGLSLMAGAIGGMASIFIESIAKNERERAKQLLGQLEDGLFRQIVTRWGSRRYIIVMFVAILVAIGALYGIYYEHLKFGDALYFSIATISSSGVPAPTCIADREGRCELRPAYAIFLAVFVTVSVPMFTLLLGQFSLSVVEGALQAKELAALSSPLTEEEYEFARQLKLLNCTALHHHSPAVRGDSISQIPISPSRPHFLQRQSPSPSSYRTSVSPSRASASSLYPDESIEFFEFLIMELIRLRRVDCDELLEIKAIFDDIDFDKSGKLSKDKVNKWVNQSQKQCVHQRSRAASTVSSKADSTYAAASGAALYQASEPLSSLGRDHIQMLSSKVTRSRSGSEGSQHLNGGGNGVGTDVWLGVEAGEGPLVGEEEEAEGIEGEGETEGDGDCLFEDGHMRDRSMSMHLFDAILHHRRQRVFVLEPLVGGGILADSPLYTLPE